MAAILDFFRGRRERWPKAPSRARRALGARRAPQPSAGTRRRGAERPELLVLLYFTMFYYHIL